MAENVIKILVVDDDIHVLKTLSAIIEEFGMEPVQAENVPEALELLKTESVELILTDIVMPEIDGLEFIDIVKDSYPSIPIAVISAYGIISNTVNALNKGAYNFVTKPFSLDEIRIIINKGLRLRNLSLNTDILAEKVTNTTTMHVPSEPDLFTAISYYIIKECQWRGIENDILLTNITICLDELLDNAHYHGNKEVTSKTINITSTFKNRILELCVADEGEGFNHQEFLEQIKALKPLAMQKKGLFIIQNMVDELTFNAAGNEVQISIQF